MGKTISIDAERRTVCVSVLEGATQFRSYLQEGGRTTPSVVGLRQRANVWSAKLQSVRLLQRIELGLRSDV